MRTLDAPLLTAAAPQGIISFEVARTLPAARAMLDSWGADGAVWAGLCLGVDYLFLVAYAVAIGLACALLAGATHGWCARLGCLLAWAQLLAGLLDAVENFALAQLLLGRYDALWSQLAWGCALPKFFLVFCGLAYFILVGIALCIVKCLPNQSTFP
jgi:hypothetical protein